MSYTHSLGAAKEVFGKQRSISLENIPIGTVDIGKNIPKNVYTYSYFSEGSGDVKSYSNFVEVEKTIFGTKEVPLEDNKIRFTEKFWLDINSREYEVVSLLRNRFRIHSLTIEDILEFDYQYNREKYEVFDDYIFIYLRLYNDVPSLSNMLNEHIEPFDLFIILFENGIITIHDKVGHHKIMKYNGNEGYTYATTKEHTEYNVYDNMKGTGDDHTDENWFVYEKMRLVIDKLENSKVKFNSSWIMYYLLNDIIYSFFPKIRLLEIEIDTIDEIILILTESDQIDMLKRIGRARKRITFMYRSLFPKYDLIRSLIKRNEIEYLIDDDVSFGHKKASKILDSNESDIELEKEGHNKGQNANNANSVLNWNVMAYLRDTKDSLMIMIQNLDNFNESLNRSHSNYLAQISIDLTQASNNVNVIMKKLSVYATIFLPLTLFSGIMGMNVPVPGQLGTGLGDMGPFICVLILMLLLTLLCVYIARRFHWF